MARNNLIGIANKRALHGDNNTSSININSGGRFAAGDDITLATWVNMNTTKSSCRFMTRFYGSDSNGRSGSLGLNNPASGGVVATGFFFFLYNGSTSLTLSGPAYTLGTWAHVVGSWNQTTGIARLYVNGKLVSTGTLLGPSDASTSGPKLLSTSTGATPGVDGALWGTRSWSRQLTKTEVKLLYHCDVVPATGLKGEWLYTEADGSATVADTSGNGYNGTVVGAPYHTESQPAVSRQVASGRQVASRRLRTRDMGTSLNYDGTATNQVTSSQASVASTKWATAFWVNFTPTAARQNFIYRGNGDTNYPRIYTQGSTDYRPTFQYVMSGQSSQSHIATVSLVPKKWNHVACVINNDTGVATTYVNGVAAGNSAPNGGVGINVGSGSSAFTIARDTNLSITLLGNIDEVIQWRNYAPTDAEIASLYFNGVVPGNPTRVYRFNEAAGTVAVDTSGNNNTGTISGPTYSTNVPLKARTAA